MPEALTIAPDPAEIGFTPESCQPPKIKFVPYDLWKSTLIQRRLAGEVVPESMWKERALRVEEYVQSVLETQTQIIERVEIDLSNRDSEGPDLQIFFVEDFPTLKYPIRSLKGEVKSSTDTNDQYKTKEREELFEEQIRSTMIGPWHPDAMALEMDKKRKDWESKTIAQRESIISLRLTEKGIILINGGATRGGIEKTPEKILYKSFYPQVFRYIERLNYARGKSNEVIYGRFNPLVQEIKQRTAKITVNNTDGQNSVQIYPRA